MTVVFFTDRDLGNRFPEILKANSFTVERHSDHFQPACPDEEWLAEVARRGWVAVTHDTRIRYKPNELAAVIRHGVRLVVVVGKAPHPDLARSFVNTRASIEAFIEETAAPFIAKSTGPAPRNSPRTPLPVGGSSGGTPRADVRFRYSQRIEASEGRDGRAGCDTFFPGTVHVTDRGVSYRFARIGFREIEEVTATFPIEVIGDRRSLTLGQTFCSPGAAKPVAHELQRLIIEVAEATPHARSS